MKNLFFVAVLVFSFLVPMVVSAQSVVPATGAEAENLCLDQCGPPTWRIAVPTGTPPEVSRDGDILTLSVNRTPSEAGPILRWTAEMPAHPDGSLTPDPDWLREQPFIVVLEWTTSETGLTYTPSSRHVELIMAPTEENAWNDVARVDCDCESFHQVQGELVTNETLIWEWLITHRRALLQQNPEQCSEYRLTGRHIFDSRRQVGWVLRDGHWYSLDDAREWLASPYDWRNDYMTIRYSDCPPQDVAEASGE